MRDISAIPIAIVMRAFEPGGTEHQMIELIRRLDPSRWRVHVACFRREGAWFPRVVESQADITEFPVRSFRKASTWRHLSMFAGWCRQKRIAIVQATELPSNLFALPGARLAGVPIRIGARREINPNKTALEIALQRGAYACATAIVANSQAAADRLRREGVPGRKITVVPNGLDAAAFSVAARPGARTVVVVANLRPEKRHDVLLDAAPAVLKQFPDARFHIVGDGPERRRLEELAAVRGVADACVFFGHESNVADRLGEADIFVLPSESEGFPNAVLEAMAAGLPIVASDLPALRELVDHGTTGVLTRAGDAPALAAAICRLMANAPVAAAMGNGGRAAVRSRFSFDRMVASFEALYESELEQRAGAWHLPCSTAMDS